MCKQLWQQRKDISQNRYHHLWQQLAQPPSFPPGLLLAEPSFIFFSSSLGGLDSDSAAVGLVETASFFLCWADWRSSMTLLKRSSMLALVFAETYW